LQGDINSLSLLNINRSASFFYVLKKQTKIMFTITDTGLTMEDLLADSIAVLKPELGAVIEGVVVTVKKNRLVVDLNGVAVGIVTGKDTHDSQGTIKDLSPGDSVKAIVIQDEDDYGNVVLSLRKASQATAWDRFEKAYKDGEIIEVKVTEANKGGLLLDFDGIKGFIPVSQLAPMHYPRVEGADAGKILARLKKLVGIKMNVKVINVDRETGKMILSEKAAMISDSKAALADLNIGGTVKGKVSGVVKFGIFVTFNGLEGLVHISEIAWGHVSNPHQYAKIGDEIDVQVIGIEGDKLSLSMKRLTPDPWEEIAEQFPLNSTVRGKINRFSQFGAFVQLPHDINGLIHLSEIADGKVDDPSDFLEIGQEVEAKVINIDSDEHRIGLSLKAMGGNKKRTKKKEEEAVENSADEMEAEEAPEEDENAEKETAEKKPKKKKLKKVIKADKKEEEIVEGE
jgi:small subunit ribosomal protein S1